MIRTAATAPLIFFACLAMSGCSNFWRWDPPPEQTVQQPAAADVVPERPVGQDEYMVRQNDTVYSIAFRHQLDYRALARWNQIDSSYLIFPGQVLRLTKPGPVTFTEGEITSHPDVAAVAPSSPPRALPKETIGERAEQAAPAPSLPTGPAVVAAAPTQQQPAPSSGASTGVGEKRPKTVGKQPYQWQWPTEGVVVRGYNLKAGSKGLDFSGSVGQSVVAAAPGKVVYSGSALKGYGELIIIKHDDLRLSAYGYNKTRLVNEGELVRGGQPIAEMGLGPENKPILHFEIRRKGKPVNPVPFLPAKKSRVRRS